MAVYWLAYAKYYEAIHHLKTNNRELCEEVIQEGIALLEKKKNKDSEDNALLSIIQCFSLQFETNPMRMGMISEQVAENAQKAIKANAGGAKAEPYLLKAISLEAQAEENASLPSWGKDLAYQMLISLYLKKGDQETAQKYQEEAKQIK